jgi:molybdopterin-guanine dinucleotide biosynthesis protein A
MELVAGIFVGGRASRMGGVAKGLLVSPDGEPILHRTRRILEDAGARCVLVGANAAYADLGWEVLADDASASGPLAGILALLAYAGDRFALAVACDMPLIAPDLVRRLIDAPPAPIVAPRRRDRVHDRELWEPLFARYESRTVLPVARVFASEGGRKLQLLLDRAGARALALTSADDLSLTDWDAPGDLPEAAPRGTRMP